MSHSICRVILKGARIDYKTHFKKHIQLSCSQFKISNSRCDYEVRERSSSMNQWPRVITTSTCCSYDAKAKALYELIENDKLRIEELK